VRCGRVLPRGRRYLWEGPTKRVSPLKQEQEERDKRFKKIKSMKEAGAIPQDPVGPDQRDFLGHLAYDKMSDTSDPHFDFSHAHRVRARSRSANRGPYNDYDLNFAAKQYKEDDKITQAVEDFHLGEDANTIDQMTWDWNTWRGKDRPQFSEARANVFRGWKKEQEYKSVPRFPPPETVAFVPPRTEDETAPNLISQVPHAEFYSTLPMPTTDHTIIHVPTARYPEVSEDGTITGSGGRKSARAGVQIHSPGTGKVLVNGRHWMDYFGSIYVRAVMLEPIIATEKYNKVDISCTVNGGGYMGQAVAIRHAIANALVRGDPEYRLLMADSLMMKKDLRVRERKHTGRRKARRRQQWVKR